MAADVRRRPLILRGARQVGKTWLVGELARERNLALLEVNLALLAAARLCKLIPHTEANGLPLAAEQNASLRKAALLDVGLAHALWNTPALRHFPRWEALTPGIRGGIGEQMGAQQLHLFSGGFTREGRLFHWRRGGGHSGEIDCLLELDGTLLAPQPTTTMQTSFDIMPIDRTTIKTRLKIHPDLFDDPNEYIRKHTLQIRTAKATNGRCKRGPTRNLTLKVLTYGGIEAKLSKVLGDPLTDVTIHFNPGKCLFNHNGSVLSLAGFFDAVAILVTHLKPLLKDPEDWVDLIPGLRSGGVAYWSYLEILLQYPDPDGTLLAGFRNAQRKSTQTKIRHWPESMVIGGKRSNLQFGIYRKAVEMVAKDKLPSEQLENYEHILRLEVRLQGKKLVQHLGNKRTVEEIDGDTSEPSGDFQ